jgi:PAS domain S-box-containing protein
VLAEALEGEDRALGEARSGPPEARHRSYCRAKAADAQGRIILTSYIILRTLRTGPVSLVFRVKRSILITVPTTRPKMGSESRKYLLLVEDEPLIAMSERTELEDKGYKVLVADSGEEALKAVGEEPRFDLILMDIDLGRGMDGTEAARRILRKLEIPIVFLSSHVDPKIVERTEEITSYGYVVKNSGIIVLDTSIKMALRLFTANRTIAESDQRQRAMISNIADVISVFSRDGIVRYTTPNIEKWFGWRPEEIVGSPARSRIHPEDLDRIRAFVSSLVDGARRIGSIELRLRCRDGSYKPIEATASNLLDEPYIRGILLTYRDITERKKAEEALKDSEEKSRAIIEQSKDGIVITDGKGNITTWNESFGRITGVDGKEALGKPLWEMQWGLTPENLRTPELLGAMRKFITDCLRGETDPQRSKEGKIRAGDGRIRTVDASYFIIEPNGERMFCALFRDVTERKSAEGRLLEYGEKLDSIMKAAKIIWWELDMDTGDLRFDREVVGMFGYPTGRFRSYADFLVLVHPEDLVRIEEARETLASGRSGSCEIEFRGLTKTGDYRWFYLTCSSTMEGSAGVPPRLAGLLMDIDPRKKSEEEIRSLLEEKELILKEVHHRVKNNMGTMKSLIHLQMLKMKDPTGIAALDDAESRLDSMILLYDILYRSSSYREVSMKSYLSDLIRQVLENFPHDKAISVEERIEDFLLDTRRLQPLAIIVNELLTNIMKYAFAGKREGTIKVSASLRGDRVSVAIEDDGIGMPETVDFERSTGFGLMLVNSLTKQLDGAIRIDRAFGTRVSLDFAR